MKTLGIIGGLGPETTANFYLEVISSCLERNRSQRPPVIIWNVPLEFKIEEDIIVRSKDEERLIPYLVEAARHLERGGADFIVIPCNTAHLFIDKVRNSTSVPILSILEESVKFLRKKKVKRVGILATFSTIKNHLYDLEMKNNSIELVFPEDSQLEIMGDIIHRLVTSNYTLHDRDKLLKIIQELHKKDLDAILLACTDLQLLIPSKNNTQIFDTMSILAQASVDKLLSD